MLRAIQARVILVTIYLLLTPDTNIKYNFSDICIDAIKTGLKGKTGNKGGVAISFNLYATSLCFVCAHLAAGQNNVLDGNKHYEYIRDKALFDNVRRLLLLLLVLDKFG